MRVLVASDGIGRLDVGPGRRGAGVGLGRSRCPGAPGRRLRPRLPHRVRGPARAPRWRSPSTTGTRSPRPGRTAIVVLQVSAPDGGGRTAARRPPRGRSGRRWPGCWPSRGRTGCWSISAGCGCTTAGAGMLAGLGVRADQPLDQGVQPLAAMTEVDLARGARGPRRHRTDRRRAGRSDSASTCSACAESPRSAVARRDSTRPTCWPPTPRWTGSPDSPRPTRRPPPAPARAVVSGSPCWPWVAG